MTLYIYAIRLIYCEQKWGLQKLKINSVQISLN